jgi:intracellular sulfur oxidation DsrE/DsrF family protein
MRKFQHLIGGATMGLISFFLAGSLSTAREIGQPASESIVRAAAAPKHKAVAKPGNSTTRVSGRTRSAFAHVPPSAAASKEHRLILQVNTNDAAAMNLALNNANNVTQYYKDLGEKVSIEVVTFGPGLHMLRNDTSPVKARIEEMASSAPEVSFKACGNTQEKMQKAENRDIPIIPQAQVVKSGVVRVMELQERGWTYVRP